MAYTRRQFVGKAVIAGAGATMAGPFLESAIAASRGEGITGAPVHSLRGQLAALSSNGALTVVDREGRSRAARVSSATRIWKQSKRNGHTLDRGDTIFATGSLGADGVFGIDRAWVAIEGSSGDHALWPDPPHACPVLRAAA